MGEQLPVEGSNDDGDGLWYASRLESGRQVFVASWVSELSGTCEGLQAVDVEDAVLAPLAPNPNSEMVDAPQGGQDISPIYTGEGGTLEFPVGAEVWGYSITMINWSCTGGGCYVQSAPMPGSVSGGVVYPAQGEVQGTLKVFPNEGWSEVQPQQESSAPENPVPPTETPNPGSCPAGTSGEAVGPAILETMVNDAWSVVKLNSGSTIGMNDGACWPFQSQSELDAAWPAHRDAYTAKNPDAPVIEQ